MEQVWSICKKLKEFSFYELMTPREPFVIFDRYEHVHPDLGIILEPVSIIYECIDICIYMYNLLKNKVLFSYYYIYNIA